MAIGTFPAGRRAPLLSPAGWLLGGLLLVLAPGPAAASQTTSDLRRLERDALGGSGAAHREAVERLAHAGEAAAPHLARIVERGALPVRLVALRELTRLGAEGQGALGAALGRLGPPDSIPGDVRMGVDHVGLEVREILQRTTLNMLIQVSETTENQILLEGQEQTAILCFLRKVAMGDAAAALQALQGDRRRERSARDGNDLTLVAFASGIAAADPAPIEFLVGQLSSRSTHARHLALAGLAALGPKALEARPHLVGLLGDRDRAVAMRAAEALASIGGTCEGTHPAVASWLEGRDLRARALALCILRAAHPEDTTIQAELIAMIGSRDAAASHQALLTLARLRQPSPEILAALETQLVHSDLERRLVAVYALRALGAAGAPLRSVAQAQLRAEAEGSPVISPLEITLRVLETAR